MTFWTLVLAAVAAAVVAWKATERSTSAAPPHAAAVVKIVVVKSPWRETSFRHVRELAATNPWGWTTSAAECDMCGGERCENKRMAEKSVSCAHRKAYRSALESGADVALVFEDDAQLVPQFWSHLESRLSLIALNEGAGVVWLDHLVLPVANFSDAWSEGVHTRCSEGKTIARKFSRGDGSGLWADCVWGAGGYLISRKAMLFAEETAAGRKDEHFVSEDLLCAAAEKFGGYLSSPPLVYQCSNGRNGADSVQTLGKHLMDRRARSELMREFRDMVARGVIDDRVQLPDYLLEECVV
jgi:hypothetical protein